MTSGGLWRRVAAVVLLAAASVALYGWVPHYRLVGAELLQNPGFAGGFDHWHKSDGIDVADGALRLRNDVPGRIVGVDQLVDDPAPGYYSFAAEARASAVVRGVQGGNLARLAFASVDRAGAARWDRPHIVVLLAGSGGWQQYARVFKVPPASSAAWAIVQLFSATGTFEVRHLSVRRAEPLPAFLYASRALLGLWVLAGLWVGWPLLAAAGRDRRIAAVVLVGLAIGVATQMPNAGKTELLLLFRDAEERVAALLQRASIATSASGPTAGAAINEIKAAEAHFSWHGLDKIGHFLMHVLLGMATLWAFRRQSRATVLLCLLLFSGVTEVWQNFAIDRDPLLSDALINIGGALTGAALTLAALYLLKPRVRPADPPAA